MSSLAQRCVSKDKRGRSERYKRWDRTLKTGTQTPIHQTIKKQKKKDISVLCPHPLVGDWITTPGPGMILSNWFLQLSAMFSKNSLPSPSLEDSFFPLSPSSSVSLSFGLPSSTSSPGGSDSGGGIETDLILAAELGRALLEKNEELAASLEQRERDHEVRLVLMLFLRTPKPYTSVNRPVCYSWLNTSDFTTLNCEQFLCFMKSLLTTVLQWHRILDLGYSLLQWVATVYFSLDTLYCLW